MLFLTRRPALVRCGLLAAAWLLLPGARPAAAQCVPDSVVIPSPSSRPAAMAPRRRLGLVLSLDNRESFLQSSAVQIIGLNAGVVLPGGRWRFGLGGYTLRRDYANLYTYQYKNGKRTRKIADTLTPQLSLTYLTPNVSYVFFQRPWLEVSVPLEAGLGRSHYTETDQHDNITTDSHGLFVPVQAGLAVLVRPLRWVGVSGSVGYRKSVFAVNYKEDFDGMYYSYRLNVFVGAIWRDWRQYQRRRHAAQANGKPGK